MGGGPYAGPSLYFMKPRELLKQFLAFLEANGEECGTKSNEEAVIEEFFTLFRWECAMCSHEWEAYVPLGLEDSVERFVECPSCEFKMGYEVEAE